MKIVKKILVSQPRPASERSPYFDMEKKYGVEFCFQQLIQIVGLTPTEFRTQHINPLDYTAVIFSSKLAIDHYFRLMEEMRLKVPETMHYYCISEVVATYLQKYIQYRKRKVFYGNNSFVDVIPAMNRRQGEKALMVMSDVSSDSVIQLFAAHKITVTPAVMYRTVPITLSAEELDYDMIVLFTPTGVDALRQSFGEAGIGDRVLACYGPKTAQAIKDQGWNLEIEAPTEDCPSVTAAIGKYLAAQKKG